MDLENLLDRTTTALSQLSKDRIMEVCQYLKCIDETDEAAANKSRRTLIKTVEARLDDIEQNMEADEAISFIRELLTFMGSKEDDSEGNERESSQAAQMKGKYLELQQARETLDEEIKNIGEQLKIADIATVSPVHKLSPAKVPEVTIRREFRICGQIGEGGQRDKLSFTNLMHQIESGLRKGHGEAEVIEAVIRAISPGLKLRDMLEIKPDLTLSQLKIILKGHYKEDDTTDLYQKLISISQEPKESAQDFLFRAIELKDRLLYAAKGGETEEHYSADLVKKKFLRSVGTGLLNDNIKFQIKPFLDNLDVTDETLIEKVTEAANLETERLNKLKRTSTKPPRVNELHTNCDAGDNPQGSTSHTQSGRSTKEPSKEKSKPAHVTPEPEVHTLVKELQTEVAEMKRLMLASMSTGKSQHSKQATEIKDTRRRGCRACQDNGEGASCSHCFKCGQLGHVSRGCRAPQRLQGNFTGLLPRDQQ